MTPASKTAAVQQYDLLDLAKAAQGAIELNKLHEKEAAASFIVNRIYGYLDPEHRAEFGDEKGLAGDTSQRTHRLALNDRPTTQSSQ